MLPLGLLQEQRQPSAIKWEVQKSIHLYASASF